MWCTLRMFFKWDQLLVLIIQRVEENLKKVEIPRLLPMTPIPDINGSPTRGGDAQRAERGSFRIFRVHTYRYWSVIL